jgi:hypothetical protein
MLASTTRTFVVPYTLRSELTTPVNASPITPKNNVSAGVDTFFRSRPHRGSAYEHDCQKQTSLKYGQRITYRMRASLENVMRSAGREYKVLSWVLHYRSYEYTYGRRSKFCACIRTEAKLTRLGRRRGLYPGSGLFEHE